MEKRIEYVRIAVAVLGIIGSLVLAYYLGNDLEVGYYGVDIERNPFTTFLIFISGLFIVYVEDTILASLYSIVCQQNELKKIIADLKLKNSVSNEELKFENNELPPL